MPRVLVACALVGCAVPAGDARTARILDTLAEDNYVQARREPDLVRMKLLKMQRGPYEWLRGTAALYWRDVMEPGAVRAGTAFGDPRSSRVLLVGDAHIENVGTFRASDGTLFMDWNDFDATGYGPFAVDVRRLATAFAIAAAPDAADETLERDVAVAVAAGYCDAIETLARGDRMGTMGEGMHPLFDKELEKARKKGDKREALEELAPVMDGVRVLATGDLEPVADDGVIADRVDEVDAEQAQWLDRAIAAWRRPGTGDIKLRARRIGSGVASYAVYRFQVVLDGPTPAVDDDVLLELKETRDGVIMRGVPMLAGAEWASPAIRAVDTQRRLQARPDADVYLDAAQVGGLSLKIRAREAYQRGMDAGDIGALASEPASLVELARFYGSLLGRAHGGAMTSDGDRGASVIAPLLAGREPAFADEIAARASDDAAQVRADYARMHDADLAASVIPGGTP